MTERQRAATLARIRLNCAPTEDGHLVYRSKRKAGPLVHVTDDQGVIQRVGLYRAAWMLEGKAQHAGMNVYPACGVDGCIAHLAKRSVSATQAALANRVDRKTHAIRCALAQGRRSKVSPEMAAAIRAGGDLAALAKEAGISLSYASAIRRGDYRKPLAASPWSGLGV
ncbi:hypothetical protein CCO03_17060 [Comamonas serinivorans]|uniref:Uncharacterized protein n=2 Tax=Comamonas serinivorans TaxID=1082851 RepID=A0A1Y0ERF0_9BURK|nr:hypothetical protein CCO03_17060 [Comamonas serinivorans]